MNGTNGMTAGGTPAPPRSGAARAWDADLRSHLLGPVIARAARAARLRRRCIAAACRLEGGQFYSRTARVIAKRDLGIEIGAYSYGPCFEPGAFPAGVRIGRYVSIAAGVQVLLRNHPTELLSMHPFFFNAMFGVVELDYSAAGTLEIGSDAWLGTNAVLTPGCSRVGIGAVVGAGAVVTRDVPDFAVVVGNPARVLRMRFDERARAAVRASEWWELPLEECRRVVGAMTKPIGSDWTHPLIAGAREQGPGGAMPPGTGGPPKAVPPGAREEAACV